MDNKYNHSNNDNNKKINTEPLSQFLRVNKRLFLQQITIMFHNQQANIEILGAKNFERKLNDGNHLLFAAERLLFLPRQIEFGNARFKTTRKQT